ncbi:hypothetical protein [Laspinema palackyanum]|uniref:hypothetical protein n=1 Tax=Laspinema palackyanum TaxID=3231601 RepID=UPI00345D35C3|nr:hypothetical protein [Laspinema sp. D2c]
MGTIEAFVRQEIKKLDNPKDNIVQFWPDKSRDSNSFLVAGSEKSIKEQISHLSSLYQFGLDWFGVPIDLDKFLEDFSGGFPSATEFLHPELKDKAKPWGIQELKERPFFRRINKEAEESRGYCVVEFWPGGKRGEKPPVFVLVGPPMLIVAQVSQIWAQYNLLRNELKEYDVGAIVGWPIDDYLRQQPKKLKVNIRLSLNEKPPFNKLVNGIKIPPRQVSIPMPDRGKLNYQSLRDACGGSGGLQWGRWSARGYVAGSVGETRLKGLSQLVAGGSSEDGAYQNLARFAQLSGGFVVGRSATGIDTDSGNRKRDRRYPSLNSFRVYPAFCWIENSDLIALDDARHSGKPTLSGKLVSRENRLPLWLESPPDGWQQLLNELLRSPL